MRKNHATILVLAIGTVLLLAGLASGAGEKKAEEKEEESVWHEDEPRGRGGGFGRFELTDEVIEHMISRLAEKDPAKAEELAKLREKDPEKFKAELREVMREQFGQRWREHRGGRGGAKYRPWWWQFSAEEINEEIRRLRKTDPERAKELEELRGKDPERFRVEIRKVLGRRFGWKPRAWVPPTLTEWLKENYPEEAERLAELRKKDLRTYKIRRDSCHRRYRGIYEAAKENPELAEILKEDLELKDRRDTILEQVEKLRVECSDEEAGPTVKEKCKKEIETLKAELREVLANRFELIVKRKEIEYEQLLDKLRRLQEQVEKRKAELENWKDAEFMKDSVKSRLHELLGEKGRFWWD